MLSCWAQKAAQLALRQAHGMFVFMGLGGVGACLTALSLQFLTVKARKKTSFNNSPCLLLLCSNAFVPARRASITSPFSPFDEHHCICICSRQKVQEPQRQCVRVFPSWWYASASEQIRKEYTSGKHSVKNSTISLNYKWICSDGRQCSVDWRQILYFELLCDSNKSRS